MSLFVPKEWKDRLAEFAGRRKLTNVSTGEETTVDVSRAEGEVSQAGDAFSAANMNDLEQRIKDGFDKVDADLSNEFIDSDRIIISNTQIVKSSSYTATENCIVYGVCIQSSISTSKAAAAFVDGVKVAHALNCQSSFQCKLKKGQSLDVNEYGYCVITVVKL